MSGRALALAGRAAGAFGLGRGRRLIERNLLVARRTWWIPLSGIAEPVFYLLSIGIGIGKLVGGIPGPRRHHHPLRRPTWPPALLAASAMNGAVYESTFNVYFKLKYAKVYDAVLATPLEATDVARGEITYALIRGAVYAAVFVVMMAALGDIDSAWAVLALPAAVLIGFAFAAVGMAATTYMRGWTDFDLVQLVLLPAVPVLDHLLPPVHLPPLAAARRRVHAPLPGRQPGPGPHPGRGRAGRARPRRLPGGHGSRRAWPSPAGGSGSCCCASRSTPTG